MAVAPRSTTTTQHNYRLLHRRAAGGACGVCACAGSTHVGMHHLPQHHREPRRARWAGAEVGAAHRYVNSTRVRPTKTNTPVWLSGTVPRIKKFTLDVVRLAPRSHGSKMFTLDSIWRDNVVQSKLLPQRQHTREPIGGISATSGKVNFLVGVARRTTCMQRPSC